MGVKTIFKCLILTVLVSVIGLMLIEMYNMAMISPMVRVNMNRCLAQACQYFAQETYKTETDGKMSGSATELRSADGVYNQDELMSGNLYLRQTNDKAGTSDVMTSTDEVYKFIYTSDEYKDWYNNIARGKWTELDNLAYGLNKKYGIMLDVTNKVSNDKDRQSTGDRYAEDYMTALNLGVTYLDKTTVTNICRYQLAASMMNGIPSNLVLNTCTENDSEDGNIQYVKSGANINGLDKPYVKFNGFWVYWDTFNITDIDYKCYDLGYMDGVNYAEPSSKSDIIEFEELTGIDVVNYVKKSLITKDDERRYVVVATLSYSCEVRYEGTTAFSRILRYAFSNDTGVDGYIKETTTNGGDAKNVGNSANVDGIDLDSEANISREVIDANAGDVKLVTDTIIYYNIR